VRLFSSLYPHFCFEKVEEIGVDFLRKNNISALILDIDNTLVRFGATELGESTRAWIESLKSAGIRMVLLSNGLQKRRLAISQNLGVPLVESFLPKPFPFGFRKAVKFLGVPEENICAVGDIVFTDILGANLIGVRTILVEPLSGRDFLGTKFWRFLERKLNLRRPKTIRVKG